MIVQGQADLQVEVVNPIEQTLISLFGEGQGSNRPAGGGGFLQLGSLTPDAGNHEGLAVASQGVLQHMCQLGGAVGNVIPASHRQRYNHLQASAFDNLT